MNRNAPEPTDALYEIDPATGVTATGEAVDLGPLTVLGSNAEIGFFTGLAIDPTDGTIYGTAAMLVVPFNGHVLLTLDAETFDATSVGDMMQACIMPTGFWFS